MKPLMADRSAKIAMISHLVLAAFLFHRFADAGYNLGAFWRKQSAPAATQLVFSTNPSSNAILGIPLGTQPVVKIRDANNNPTSSTAAVTLSPYTDATCTTIAAGENTSLEILSAQAHSVFNTLLFSGIKSANAAAPPVTHGVLSSSGTGITVSATAGTATFTQVKYLSSLVPLYIKATSPGLTSACTSQITLSTYVTNSTNSSSSGVTSLTVNSPSAASGQLMILVASSSNWNTAISGPTGWTQLVSNTTTSDLTQKIFYKIAGASEPTSYTYTQSQSRATMGEILVYSGINTTTPFETSNGQTNGASTTVTAPSVTTAQATSQLVVALSSGDGTSYIPPPSGFTFRTYGDTGNAPGVSVVTADKVLTSAGATGMVTSKAGGSYENLGQVMVLNLQ